MGYSIVEWITYILGANAGEMIGTVVISMLPVIELRGAIPVAYALGLNWQTAMLCAVVGNLLPIPFILLFIDWAFAFMKRHGILVTFVEKLEAKAIAKYQFWRLALFVAIPLPGTGGWIGALIASMMKTNKKDALLSISAPNRSKQTQ